MRAIPSLLPPLIFILALCRTAFAEQLTVVYGADYKPFAWGDAQQVQGIQKDMVEAVLSKKLGLTVVHEACPWARCQLLVKQGLKDAFFTVPTPERATYTRASARPFYQTQFLMHTRRDNPNIPLLKNVTDLQSLAAYPSIRHVFMLGSGWHESNLSHMIRIERIKDSSKIPLMLDLGRADLYIEQEELFRYQAQELGLDANMLTLKSPVMQEVGWHLFISNQSSKQHLLAQINTLLDALHHSGELKQIRNQVFKKYGID